MLGGTLTEIAIRQGRVDGLIAWLRELGLRHVEISDGTIALAAERQARADRNALARSSPSSPRWAARTPSSSWPPTSGWNRSNGTSTAGAWKVIAEARESGTAGIYRANGEPRTGLIDEIAHVDRPASGLIFDAPLHAQQVWLLKHFGTECNLGNIAPADVLSLETLRLGLRSDTVERFALGGAD